MTIPEVFQLRKPMVVSDFGNAGVLISEGKTGVKFVHNDPKALMNAVERLENMDIEKLGQAAFETFKKEYSAESNYEKLIQIYNEIGRGL